MTERYRGKFEDLGEPKSGFGQVQRYACPYCSSIHGKSKSNEACVTYDHKKGIGTCFRCNSLILSSSLKDLKYISEILDPFYKKKKELANSSQLYNINWTTPIRQNREAWEYLHNRMITNEAMERFNIRACTDPYLGVVYINKLIDGHYTDFYQIRLIEDEEGRRHVFLKNSVKTCNWLDYADTCNLILVEGYTSGLSAYQHSLGLNSYLNPIVLGGKTLTENQVLQLKDFTDKKEHVNICICLDGGFFEEALKLANIVYQNCYNTTVRIMNLPYKKDPNDINKETFIETFKDSQVFEPQKLRELRNKVYKK